MPPVITIIHLDEFLKEQFDLLEKESESLFSDITRFINHPTTNEAKAIFERYSITYTKKILKDLIDTTKIFRSIKRRFNESIKDIQSLIVMYEESKKKILVSSVKMGNLLKIKTNLINNLKDIKEIIKDIPYVGGTFEDRKNLFLNNIEKIIKSSTDKPFISGRYKFNLQIHY